MPLDGDKIASVPDDGNAAKVQPSDMNPFTAGTGTNTRLYVEVLGTPEDPGSSITIRVYAAGAWHDVASRSW